MKKKLSFISCSVALVMAFSSCKKESSEKASTTIKSLATLGLYQYQSGTVKRIFIPITKVGTQAVTYYSVFDTGSSGMTLDANGILPASMITSSGISFTGDSVVVNGITVTNKTSTMSYGDATSTTKEYGNLAYAPITIGDANGNITTKRIPFFLYYKIMNTTTNTQLPAHAADIFGVAPGTSYASTLIASPLSYFDLDANLTQGFRLAMLNSAAFSTSGTYVAGLLSIGLTPTDVSTETGFIMHPLSTSLFTGYSPNIQSTITYNGTTTTGPVLFDTGNPSVSIIENIKENAVGDLPENSTVTITTNRGFTYTYTTTSTSNLTTIQNPNNTQDYRTILSLDFFIRNEYLTDYTNHRIGLKNN
jgi:hypothetical protein